MVCLILGALEGTVEDRTSNQHKKMFFFVFLFREWNESSGRFLDRHTIQNQPRKSRSSIVLSGN